MRSSKSRSRNKSNRQRSLGNVVNRVFDSSGPEGKVRGTPQQIIEKYLTLARDAQLSNDRVAEQSFLQHAEHYTRMLGEAQREMAERQSQQNTHGDDRDDNAQQGSDEGQGNGGNGNGGYHQNGNGHGNGNGHQGQNRHESRQDRNGERNERRDHDRQDRQDRQDRADHRNEQRAERQREPRPSVQSNDNTDDQGLPDVIVSDDESGPVATPEAALDPQPSTTANTPDADVAAVHADDGAPAAPRVRRPRATATKAEGAPRAPRSRKPAEGKAAKQEEVSGE